MIEDIEKNIRIDWEKAIDKQTKKPDRRILNDEAIKEDFNDRLVTRKISDYEEYKEWVTSLDSKFRVIILKESLKKSLIQN